MEKPKLPIIEMLDAMDGIPACCFEKLESICEDFVSATETTKEVKGSKGVEGELTSYTYEARYADKYMRLEVQIGSDLRNYTYRETTGAGDEIGLDLEVVQCRLHEGSWRLEFKRSLVGGMKPHRDTKFACAFEDTKIEKTNVTGKQSYLSQTKVGNSYPKYEDVSLERIAESLTSLVYWGYPGEKIINIKPLEMINGELQDLVQTLNSRPTTYTMVGSGSTGATGRQLKIRHTKK